MFTSAPVLSHPGPSRQFIVEADVSDTVVGAGLSQRDPVDQKLHPCVFLSRHLSPAERNNDVGIHERWFWLCRSENNGRRGQSNLSSFGLISRTYLHSAKRLNSCQAHWALFLGRFNFTRTYRPESRNLKPDTPSHQLTPEPSTSDPDPILLCCGG